MKRKIVNPIWENGDRRDRIKCTFEYHFDDGRVQTAPAVISPDSPDWPEAIEIRSEEEMDKIWSNRAAEREQRRERQRELQQREKERKLQEKLFAKKLEIFEIDAIKDSKNRKVKSLIRRAKSDTEALLYASVLINESVNNPE